MWIKKRLLIFTIGCCALPLMSYADVSADNNTNANITGKLGFLCSAMLGSNGILKAHQSLNVSQSDIDKFCNGSCSLNLFASDNCSGNAIATIKAKSHDGVISIVNHHVKNYVVTGGGSHVTIEGGPVKRWYEYFSRYFS